MRNASFQKAMTDGDLVRARGSQHKKDNILKQKTIRISMEQHAPID